MNSDHHDGEWRWATAGRTSDPLLDAQDLVISVLASSKLDRSAREKLATATRHIGQAQSTGERVVGVLRVPLARVFFIISILAMLGSLITFVATLIS